MACIAQLEIWPNSQRVRDTQTDCLCPKGRLNLHTWSTCVQPTGRQRKQASNVCHNQRSRQASKQASKQGASTCAPLVPHCFRGTRYTVRRVGTFLPRHTTPLTDHPQPSNHHIYCGVPARASRQTRSDSRPVGIRVPHGGASISAQAQQQCVTTISMFSIVPQPSQKEDHAQAA